MLMIHDDLTTMTSGSTAIDRIIDNCTEIDTRESLRVSFHRSAKINIKVDRNHTSCSRNYIELYNYIEDSKIPSISIGINCEISATSIIDAIQNFLVYFDKNMRHFRYTIYKFAGPSTSQIETELLRNFSKRRPVSFDRMVESS